MHGTHLEHKGASAVRNPCGKRSHQYSLDVRPYLPLLISIGLWQGSSDGQTTIRTDVTQVLVPVVVTDKAGHHVTGLHVSDFRLTEDGTAQRIVSFSTSSSSSSTFGGVSAVLSTPANSPSKPSVLASTSSSPKRTYLICIDTLHSSFANFGRVRQALKSFFDKEKPGDAQYALLAIGRQTQIIQDSTRDPSEVLAAITDKKFMKTIVESETARMASDVQQFTYFMRDDYCNKCACESFNSANIPGCSAAQARLQGYLVESGERIAILDRNFYSALEGIVSATASMPTIRTILLISDGFNRLPGRELYGVMSGFGPKDHRFEFNPRNTTDGLQQILKIALRRDVHFYTIDSRGLYTGASLGGSTFDASTGSGAFIPQAVDLNGMSVARENTDALAELARQTGGLFFENNNDLLRGIQRAFADGREYYLLAYVPTNRTEDGAYRHISVEVSNKKLRVTAKAGYWVDKR